MKMKLYVPNPQIWVDFFEKLSTEKGKTDQSGAGRRPRVITVNQSKSSDNKAAPIKTVLPAEQTTAQAKSELERQDINPREVEEMFQRGSGRRRRSVKRKSRGSSSHKAKRQRGGKQQRGGKKTRTSHRRRKATSRRQRPVSRTQDIFEIK